jgi:hypothetical protein
MHQTKYKVTKEFAWLRYTPNTLADFKLCRHFLRESCLFSFSSYVMFQWSLAWSKHLLSRAMLSTGPLLRNSRWHACDLYFEHSISSVFL